MDIQCNTCGSFEQILPCEHCQTHLCEHCKIRHPAYCEDIQKLKQRGGGATIANMPQRQGRAGHESPEPTPPPSPLVFIPSAAPIEPKLEVLPPHTILVPTEQVDIDTAIAGVADLLAE